MQEMDETDLMREPGTFRRLDLFSGLLGRVFTVRSDPFEQETASSQHINKGAEDLMGVEGRT